MDITLPIPSTEKALQWFKENPRLRKPSYRLAVHIASYYDKKVKQFRGDSTVKLVFGANRQPGRISITPNKNSIRVRFVPFNPGNARQFIEGINHGERQWLTLRRDGCTLDLTTPLDEPALNRAMTIIDSAITTFEFEGFSAKSFQLRNLDIDNTVSDEGVAVLRRQLPSCTTMILNEASMEKRFIKWLKSTKGIEAKSQDQDGLFRRDVTYHEDGVYTVAELKYTGSVVQNIECAIGQLLRYTLHDSVTKPGEKLVIVSGGDVPTASDITWFNRISEVLNLKLELIWESDINSGHFVQQGDS